MSIIRIDHNKNNPFVMINKRGLEDEEISWGAKGIWAYLLTKPNDWKISVSHLSKIYKAKGGGEQAVYSMLNELIQFGYCTRSQERDEKGSFKETSYTILEFKIKVPQPVEPGPAHPVPADPPLTNNDIVLKNEDNIQPTKLAKKGANAPDVVFSCLKEIKDLSEDQKLRLSRLYPEDVVRDAVAFTKHPKTTIKTTEAQTVTWACKERLKPPIDEIALVEKNRKIALDIEQRVLPGESTVSCGYKSVEVYYKVSSLPPRTIEYADYRFYDNLKQALWDLRVKITPKLA